MKLRNSSHQNYRLRELDKFWYTKDFLRTLCFWNWLLVTVPMNALNNISKIWKNTIILLFIIILWIIIYTHKSHFQQALFGMQFTLVSFVFWPVGPLKKHFYAPLYFCKTPGLQGLNSRWRENSSSEHERCIISYCTKEWQRTSMITIDVFDSDTSSQLWCSTIIRNDRKSIRCKTS